MSSLSVADVEKMHYSQLVGLLKERNRPSGGVRTVQTVAVNSFLRPGSRVLEIGSNTGFTSVNLALLSGCSVVGIDVNEPSVVESRRYAQAAGVADRVAFQHGNATKLPFEPEAFDLVWLSNVTSFVDDKTALVSECLRVLALRGFLAAIPIYYHTPPPPELVERVGTAINSRLRVWTRGEWIKLFQDVSKRAGVALELVMDADYRYLDRADVLEGYCDRIVDRSALHDQSPAVREAASRRYRSQMALFNENLRYCGYSILLFQKRSEADEEELFLGREVGRAHQATRAEQG